MSSERENPGALLAAQNILVDVFAKEGLLVFYLFRAYMLQLQGFQGKEYSQRIFHLLDFYRSFCFECSKGKVIFYYILCILCFLEPLKGLKIHNKKRSTRLHLSVSTRYRTVMKSISAVKRDKTVPINVPCIYKLHCVLNRVRS